MSNSVRSLLETAFDRLTKAGTDTPRLDAELLLAHVLQTSRTLVFAYPERSLSAAEVEQFENLLRRREAREPLPYITGTREFLGLMFHVSPAVLIPRPETEVLVETVAERLTAIGGRTHPYRLLDVGTGSGCVAIGLAHLLPQAKVVAVEPSADALGIARRNATELGVAERIEWVHGSFPEAVVDRADEFDAVVSNPPYIADGDVDALQPEVRDWEPRLALVGGEEGLSVIRALIGDTPRLLARAEAGGRTEDNRGFLAMEVAAGQAEPVLALMTESGVYSGVEAIADLAGIPRVCLAWL